MYLVDLNVTDLEILQEMDIGPILAQQDIATLLNKTVSTISTKINGKYPFTLDEAVKIKEHLFNDKDISYLFEKHDSATLTSV